jgi:hypothetical protein
VGDVVVLIGVLIFCRSITGTASLLASVLPATASETADPSPPPPPPPQPVTASAAEALPERMKTRLFMFNFL